ncbi:hypothetical protein FCM35_KLT06808 [Carex littledalei]|uniref:SURF1-like protein n=1 Tax=Carex littledalei TaxID=544730 RepID=A0A833QXY7_9POAL|nr:hypothetical protein FCM35_KLT06808 [Carex littledalei]
MDLSFFQAKVLKYRIQRLEMEPVTCAEQPFFSNSMDSLDFRRIVCEGDFDEKKSIFMGPYSGTISGVTVTRYSVITPFIPREPAPGGVQTPVLVNRGWVPQEWRDKRMSGEEDLDKASSSSVASNTKDEKTAAWWNIWSKKPIRTAKEAVAPPTVKIVGIIRKSAKPSMFVQPNDPDGGHWYSVDVPMMARACGLSENAIYTIYIDEIKDEHTSSAKSHYPVPKDIGSVAGFEMMPKDHAKFAAKLYASSLVGILLAVWKIKAKV